MKIIPTTDVVIERLSNPITAWTVLIEAEVGIEMIEPFSNTSLYLEEETYKYIDVDEHPNGLSLIDGFRCYETEELAEFVKTQYTRANNIPSWVAPVVIPEGAHIIKHEKVIFCNEFIVYSSLKCIPHGD